MKHGMRVVLVAHHAHPEWGSEPQIGWQWARHLAEVVDLTLITHVRNREAIEARRLPAQKIYIDTESVAMWVNRVNDALWPKTAVLNRSLLEAVSLRAFDRGACRAVKELMRHRGVELIHRVSPVSLRSPSRLGSLGVPLVLGPLNGGLSMPSAFRDVAKKEMAAFQRLRPLARILDPRHRTLKDAASVLVARPDISVRLAGLGIPSQVMSENGVDLERFAHAPIPPRPGLRVGFVGRLIPCKGVEYLVRALPLLPEDVSLDIVGDGPERGHLMSTAVSLGVGRRISFRGAVAVDQVPAAMAEADVVCLPSLRESGGGVILEAMAVGRPVVAADHGGPSSLVRPDTGLLVAPGDPDSFPGALAQALGFLRDRPEARLRLGRCARRVAESEHDWRVKVRRMLSIYDRALCPGAASLSDRESAR